MKKVIVLGCLVLFFVPMSWAQERCEAPVWKTGDKWTFKQADGSTFSNEVVEVKNDLFIVKSEGDPELYGYDRKTANLDYRIKADGSRMKAANDLRKLFNFPIFVGKKWTDTTSGMPGQTRLGQQQEATFFISFNVEGIEDVTTAAGTFKTYKIRHTLKNLKVRKNRTGWILFWYSPEAKWWVKQEVEKSSFWPHGRLDAELISHELK
jgi:hypothetical protein